MSCNACNRWGPGTTKEKTKNTEESKELKERMDVMMKEREKQNAMWTSSVFIEKTLPKSSNSSS
jgi:hypothetical protein